MSTALGSAHAELFSWSTVLKAPEVEQYRGTDISVVDYLNYLITDGNDWR